MIFIRLLFVTASEFSAYLSGRTDYDLPCIHGITRPGGCPVTCRMVSTQVEV